MSSAIIDFVKSNEAPIDNLKTAVLEAYADNKEIADVFCANNQWQVRLMSSEGLINISWQNFLQMANEFAKFIDQETETMLKAKPAAPKK